MADGTYGAQPSEEDSGLERDDMERVAWINKNLRRAKQHSAQWRQDARAAYDFRAGKQWHPDDIAAMEEQGKVPIVFNRIERTVRAVVGMEIQNRQEVTYKPRGVEDSGLTELCVLCADWTRDNCDAEDEESEAFQDVITCGMGWTCTDMDYEQEQDGKVIIDRCDALDMFWDESSRKKNLRDARWLAHVKRVSRDDVVAEWPNFADASASDSAESLLDEETQPVDATPPRYDKDDPSTTQPKHKELVCFEWWERESFHRVQIPPSIGPDGMTPMPGKIIELSQVKWDALGPQIEAQGLQHVEQKRRVYYKAYVCDGVLLEEKLCAAQTGFTYKCMTGARDRNANTWFGLVFLMMDPQRFANKWLSQITHILNKSAKGGILAETDAFANPKQAEQTWAKAENITFANPGAIQSGKIMPKPETSFPEGYGKLLEFAIASINDTSGVSTELLGLTGTNQPGVLEDQRKKASVTILAVFFDSIRLYRKDQGRLLFEFIRKYMPDETIVRLGGPESAKYIPMLRDEKALQFDIIVDESPTSPNNKERTFAMMTQLAPALTQAGVPLPPAILEYSPLPSALVEKWQKHIEQSQQVPEQLKPVLEQMQSTIQAQQSEIGNLAAKNLKLQTDKEVEVYKINAKSQNDREIAEIRAQAERDANAMKAAIEIDKRAVEMYEANLQAVMERLNLLISTVQSSAQSQIEAQPKMVFTEGSAQQVLPALDRIFQVTQGQVDQLAQLPGALDGLGARIADSVAQSIPMAVAGGRVIDSEKVVDPQTGRVVSIRRRFANGDEDELPIRTQATLQ